MRDISKSFLSVGELNADVGEVEVAYAKLRGLQDGKTISGITITSATINKNDKNNQSQLPSATNTSPWLGPSSLPVVKDDTRDQEDTRGSKLSTFNDTNEVRENTDNYGSFIQNDTGTYTMSVNDTGTYSSEGSGTIDYLANMIFGDGDGHLRDDEGNIVERPPLNNIRGILGKLRVNDDNNSSVVIKDDMSIHALFNKADEVLATAPEVDHVSVSEENTREKVPEQVICTKKNGDEEGGGDIASLLKSSMSFVSQIGQEVELAKGYKAKATSEDKPVSNDNNKKKKSSKKMTIQLEGRSRSKNTSPALSKSPKPVTTPKMKTPEETLSNHISESSTMKSGETKKVENTKRLTIKGILHSPRYNGKKLMGSLSPNRSKNKRAVFKFDNNNPSPEVSYNVDTETDPVKADTTDITPAPDASPEASPNTTQVESTQKERTSSPAEESETPTLMSWKDLKSSNKAAEEGTLSTSVDDNITKDIKIDALSVVTEYDDTKKKIDDSTVEPEEEKKNITAEANQHYAMACSPVIELAAAAVPREACSSIARDPKDNRNVLELLADATYEIVKVCCNDTIGASFDEDTTSPWISGNETMSTREHSSIRKWRNYKRRSIQAAETDMSSVSRGRGLALANSGLETNAKSMKTEKASNTRVLGSPVPFIVMPSSEQKEKKKIDNSTTVDEQSQVLSVKSLKSPKRLSARLRSLPTKKFSTAPTLVGSRSTIKKKKDNDDFVMEDAFMEDIMKMVQLEAMNTGKMRKDGEHLPQGITELIDDAIADTLTGKEGTEGETYVV